MCLLPGPACLVCFMGWPLSMLALLPGRLAVDYSSHLSQLDKAALLEYPLHRIGCKFPAILQSSVLAGVTTLAVPLEDGVGAMAEGAMAPQSSAGNGTESESEDELEQPAKRARLLEGVDVREERERPVGSCEGSGDEVLTAEQRNREVCMHLV